MVEDKPIKVGFGTIISILIILVLLIFGAFFIYENNIKKAELNNTIESQKEEIAKKQAEIDNLKSNPIIKQETVEVNKYFIPSISSSTPNKIQSNSNYYLETDDGIIKITIKEGIPYVSSIENQGSGHINLNDYFQTASKISKEKQVIKGFDKKVADACILRNDHQYTGTVVIFLMEDMSVEYSTIQNLVNNISSQGKIEGLNNIIKIQKAKIDVTEFSNNHTETVLAFDGDNNYYDVKEFINL